MREDHLVQRLRWRHYGGHLDNRDLSTWMFDLPKASSMCWTHKKRNLLWNNNKCSWSVHEQKSLGNSSFEQPVRPDTHRAFFALPNGNGFINTSKVLSNHEASVPVLLQHYRLTCDILDSSNELPHTYASSWANQSIAWHIRVQQGRAENEGL